MLVTSSPAFKPGMKWDSNNDFLQIISNSPLFRAGKLNIFAQVAQSVEHVLGKDGVTGSIPVLGSSEKLPFEYGRLKQRLGVFA